MNDSKVHAKFEVPGRVAELCDDKDSRRLALGNMVLSPKASGGVWLVSTDAKAMAVRAACGESDGHYLVPKAVLPGGKGGECALNGK